MWIQVRAIFGGKKCHRIDGLSKLTKIEALRKQLEEVFQASADRLRLFYQGKQLEDGYTLFDYRVGINDLIQVMVKPVISDNPTEGCDPAKNKQSTSVSNKDANKENQPSTSASSGSKNLHPEENATSKYYQVDDLIDAKDQEFNGAWFEAKIVRICKRGPVLDAKSEVTNGAQDNNIESTDDPSTVTDDGLEYIVAFEGNKAFCDASKGFQLKDIRPRACNTIKYDDIEQNAKVMINYNVDKPEEFGYWFDAIVTEKLLTTRELIVTILFETGEKSVPLENCKIWFVEQIFDIEKHKPLTERKLSNTADSPIVVRRNRHNCDTCKDNPSKKCRECSCHICGGKEETDKQILCDECNFAYHLWCLKPPLTEVPEDEWYCPTCKNDDTEVVKAGEKLKASKKKAKMASANASSSRDWGKGMACAGRSKQCTIVPANHFGSIPGVKVGTLWKFRIQVSESGVHRPHVAGMHGRESEGAYSIVLAGGYEDDQDDGDEFLYTGSGGRDLSGNKRTAAQSCDQKLTKTNRALATNCAATLNTNGAEAKDWRAGKPVRVVRSHKGFVHSKYCPEEGNRYDGLYKVVKYWAEKGKSGFLVWRYLLRRDDPAPAPWTKAGKKNSKEMGLTMQYPEGFLESHAAKKKEEKRCGTAKKTKEKHMKENEEEEEPSPKKLKCMIYEIPKDVKDLIAEDQNTKLWDECKSYVTGGSKAFLDKVAEAFTCACCQEVVYKPITLECLHNVCMGCLTRSFKAELYSCPTCRHDLGEGYTLNVNGTLQDILLKLFPGYNAER